MKPLSFTRRIATAAATVAAIAGGGSAAALGVGGAVLAAPAQAAAGLPTECAQAAGTVTCSYAPTGAEQQFAVPAGVTTLHVDLVGARGFSFNSLPAEVVADLSATPGAPLYVEVGGMGGAPSVAGSNNNVTPGGAGGFNGGGAGGDASGAPVGLQSGGGGGGASDIRTCSSSDSTCATLDSRLVIAGGGGGVGGLSAGGNGGTPNGQDGQPDNPNSLPGAGATQTAGGAPGGNIKRDNPLPGHPGSYGGGGQGGPVGLVATAYGGGGGGGGLFGGGGGNAEVPGVPAGSGSAGGGGGGSSTGPPGATISLEPFSTVPGSVKISYTVPTAPPSAPAVGSATAGDGSASLTFSPPTSDGGAAITGYTVTSSPGGVTATGTGSPITVTGLTNGTSYTFTVTATNTAGTSSASAPSNPVTPTGALAITTTGSLPAGTVGSPYAATLTASGGTSPYSWSLGSGSTLPAGLTLHPDGTLTGTPAVAGAGSFTVKVTDAALSPHTATKNLTVAIAAAPTRADLGISLTHLGRLVTGQYGWYRIQATNTGNATTTRPTTVSSTLPGGLILVGGYGPGWTCGGQGQSGSCTRTAPLAAHSTSTILVLVRITAPARTVLNVTATVAPTDTTPADNIATDRVQVH